MLSNLLQRLADRLNPLPADIDQEARRVYSKVWPKHPAYDMVNIAEITNGMARVRRAAAACPHLKLEWLGKTMWLNDSNSIWEWCSHCGAVRRRHLDRMMQPVGAPEQWHIPGKDLYERTDTTTPDADIPRL